MTSTTFKANAGMVARQMDLFGTPVVMSKDELFILISGIQKEIRRGHSEEAKEVAARILTDKKERAHLYRRLVVILFEDIASTAPMTDEACRLILEGSGTNLMELTTILAKSPKSRTCDDLSGIYEEPVRGLKIDKLTDLGDLSDLDRLLLVSKGVFDLYTSDKEKYFRVFSDVLSDVQMAVIQRASSMGATHAILHPLSKLLPSNEMYYLDLEPPAVEFEGKFRSYWIDQHTRLGKRVIAALASEMGIDRTLLSDTIFLGEGALLNPPRVGWNYGLKIYGDLHGKAFYDLLSDKKMWDRLNKLRGMYLKSKFLLID